MNNEQPPKKQNQHHNDSPQTNADDFDASTSPMLDEQWLSLTQDWQEQSFEKTDMNALVKQTKRRTYWAKSLLVLDVISTLFIFAMFVYGYFNDVWSTATQVFLLGSGIGSSIYVYYEFKIRLNTWQKNCGSPEKALENAIASCQSSISYIKLIKYSFWAMLPIMNYYFYIASQEFEKSPWPPFIVVNSLIVIIWLVTHVFHKKRLKELSLLTKL
ncbi:hypothetical protein GCM10009111_01230 [Colwellia asteriadis]|uniref:RDD domain-containing protein n=1 Tax=Colwellia asteriadis TaxID=517723 RepID=A0ABN1L282_9GAMM